MTPLLRLLCQDGSDPSCTSLPESWPCSCALGLAGEEPSQGNLSPAELSPNRAQPLRDTSSAPAPAPCPGWKETFGFDLSVEAGTWPAKICTCATPSEQNGVKKLRLKMKHFVLERMRNFPPPASDSWQKKCKDSNVLVWLRFKWIAHLFSVFFHF